jgi:hypothetical protein
MGDSKSTNERGPSLVGSVELVMPVQESFVLPWLPSIQNIFFLAVHYFNFFVPNHPSKLQAGSRAGSPVSGEAHSMAHFSPPLQTKYKTKKIIFQLLQLSKS